jgi:restriction system protein
VARRGFLAELNYQAQQAEKRRRQEQAAAARAQAAAAREAERARRAAERARAAAARASEAERKAADKRAAQLHVEARQAETESMNAELAETYAQIDGLLASTLNVDDYVDLHDLKTSAQHPPFDPGKLGAPAPEVPPLVYPPEPIYQEPPAPSGIAGLFGRKKHQQVVEAAHAEHQAQVEAWRRHCAKMHEDHVAAETRRQEAEQQRLTALVAAEEEYQQQCRQREVEADARNTELSRLVNNLAFDVPEAIEEYVGIVLSNSVYPDAFSVTHEHRFDLSTRELALTVTVPEPSTLPAVKEYRYIKAKDEITSTALPVKAQKDRYANAVWQVAVRTLHEVFEADRAAKIDSIACTLGVERTAPATGLPERVPLVAVGANRVTFHEFDLANVVPQATLTHLGAAVSKSPFDLTPADTDRSVGVQGQG